MTGKVAIGILGAGLLVGCASQTPMVRSELVPAAQAKLEVKERDGGNTAVKLKVEHLAPPERIDGNAQAYVVWVKPLEVQSEAQNVGALPLDREKLKGSLETVTPHESFEIFVTRVSVGPGISTLS